MKKLNPTMRRDYNDNVHRRSTTTTSSSTSVVEFRPIHWIFIVFMAGAVLTLMYHQSVQSDIQQMIRMNDIMMVSTTSTTNSLFHPSSSSQVGSSSSSTSDRDRRLLHYMNRYQYIPPMPDYARGRDRANNPPLIFFPYQDTPKECSTGGTSPTNSNFETFFSQKGLRRSRLNEDRILYEHLFQPKLQEIYGPDYHIADTIRNRRKTIKTSSTTTTPDDSDSSTTRKRTGRFVEMGAFNGIQESNSRFYEMCLGWEGLLIEGNPINYHDVIRNRPGAHKMSFAPSCPGSGSSTHDDDDNDNSSITTGATNNNNNTDPSSIEFFIYPMLNSGLEGKAKTYDGKPTVSVPCGPLGPVLKDIFVSPSSSSSLDEQQQQERERIDFFSLDVEGAERLVLDTIDFQNGPLIEVMMIEIENNHCKGPVCEVRTLVRTKMQQEGYIRYENVVLASDVYVHPLSRYQFDKNFATPAPDMYGTKR